MQPRLLDLFCGAGGASKGYAAAGFEVVGVDIIPQPHYPFHFLKMDALEVLRLLVTYGAGDYVAIHASPPCQAWSDLQKQNKREYEDFIARVRPMLQATGFHT